MGTEPVAGEPAGQLIRVLYVLPNLDAGGAERQAMALLRELDRRRFEPVLCCIEGLGPLASEAAELGLEPVIVGRRGRFDLGGVVRLARIVRREQPAIVHSWLYLANFYGRLGGRLGGAPVVISSERAALASTKRRRQFVISAVNRVLAYSTDCVVVNSLATKAYAVREGVPPGKIAVIHNGVAVPAAPTREVIGQLRSSLGIEAGGQVVGMVARLEPEFKDYPTFLRAAALVRREMPEVRFVVVGDGPQRGELERLASALGLGDGVIFAGYRADARELQAAFDVSVLCSLSEGFSNSLLEAMSWGRPVVATNIAPIREAVRDGVEGLLVPVRDPEATAGAICRLLEDRELAARLGGCARERVCAEFSIEASAVKVMRLYSRLLEKRGVGGQ